MLSVDCINFNSVGVQEPKLHEKDEMGHLDGVWGRRSQPIKPSRFGSLWRAKFICLGKGERWGVQACLKNWDSNLISTINISD